MHKQLLLLFLIATCQLKAQGEFALRPFEDYGNCTSGFLNLAGDTIWSAQFERIYKPKNREGDYAQGWIVVFQGNFGLLSSGGKIILPFEFSNIEMSFEKDVFLVHKEKKIGIYDKDGKELYPMRIDKIESVYEQSMVYQENGKFGLLSSGMKPTLKPIYSYIDRFEFDNYYHQNLRKSDNFFILDKDSLFGLSDEDGNVFFDNSLYPFAFLNHPIYSKFPLLRTHSEKGSGMITLQNELLIPPVNNDLYLFMLQDSKGDTLHFAYIEKNDETKKAFRIDQKRESALYDQLTIGSHALIFARKKKKGYLTANFEERLIKTPYELRFGSHPINFSEEMINSIDLPFIPGSKEKSVLVLAETKMTNRNRSSYDKAYGLVNVNTGAKVKPQFQWIWPKIVGDEVFYFAFNERLEEDINSQLTIFNSALEVIDTFTINNQRIINYNNFFRTELAHEALIFMNIHGKLGAIRANGDIAVPFNYDELYPQNLDVYKHKPSDRIAAKIGENNGTITWSGKELIPIEFDYIQPFPDNHQIAAKPNGYVLYDSLYRKIIDGCQFITKAHSSSLKFYNRPYDQYLENQTFYAVKNDTAYAYFNDGFRILNEQNYAHDKKNDDLTIVQGRLLIEKSGKCILYETNIMKASPSVYYFLKKDSVYIFHYKKGITIGMKNSSVNAGLDAYIHVNEYPNKEGLISKETGEWVLKPNDYFKILTDGKKGLNITTDYFWYILKSDELIPNSMWIFDRLEKGKLERKFDVPKMIPCGEYLIARSGGKYGLLDKNYSEVLPFEYKNIVYNNKELFVKGMDNRWSVWTPEKGIIPLNCNHISLTKFTKGRLIFEGNSFAVLSDSYELLLPFTQFNSLPDTLSLLNLLGGSIIYNPEISDWRNSLSDEYKAMGRIYNNKTIIDLSAVFSTEYQVTEVIYLKDKTHSLKPVLIDEVRQEVFEKRMISFIGNRLCSYAESTVQRSKAEYLPYDIYKSYSFSDNIKSYRNFILDDKLLREATLQDIFLDNVNYVFWLDEYLTKVINQKQLFGLQCMNLPAILNEYKQNFHIERGGISFSLLNNNKPIVIPWIDLKGKIKEM